MDLPFLIKPGALIVFEGLDHSGKSTQLERFARATHAPQDGDPLFSPPPMFTHQPSGATGLGPAIYDLTESIDWTAVKSPLTRQLLHLAAHAEHYANDIIPALKERAVFMDRCWWSTYAYGYRTELRKQLTPIEYLHFVQLPAMGVMPDVVFLFTHRYTDDDLRTQSDKRTFRNYLDLQHRYEHLTVIVPNDSAGEVTAFISGELYKRGLVTVATS